EGPRVDDPAATLDRWDAIVGGRSLTLVGDGATRWAQVVNQRRPGTRIRAHPLLAGAIGRLASMWAAEGGAVDPAAVRPLYVRRPDAVLERERKARAARDTKDAKDNPATS